MGGAPFKNILHLIDVETADSEAGLVAGCFTDTVTADDNIRAIEYARFEHSYFGWRAHLFGGRAENPDGSWEFRFLHEFKNSCGAGESDRTLTIMLATVERLLRSP